jgi:hypothetical protein
MTLEIILLCVLGGGGVHFFLLWMSGGGGGCIFYLCGRRGGGGGIFFIFCVRFFASLGWHALTVDKAIIKRSVARDVFFIHSRTTNICRCKNFLVLSKFSEISRSFIYLAYWETTPREL